MSTYSFLTVQASIAGPGGNFSLGNSAGAAEEGISVVMTEEKNTMTVGADGAVMQSLHGGNSGTVTARLLKTSPVNALLTSMYNAQKGNPGNWGNNVIRIGDTYRGDVITCSICAFAKAPDLTYAKDGGLVEWIWHAGKVDELLGAGVPDINV